MSPADLPPPGIDVTSGILVFAVAAALVGLYLAVTRDPPRRP